MNVSVRVGNRRMAGDEDTPRISVKWSLALLAVVVSVALLYAYTSIRTLNVSYEVSRGLEVQRDLRETGRRLMVELNNLRSPERLEQEAQRQGLIQPKAEQMRGLK